MAKKSVAREKLAEFCALVGMPVDPENVDGHLRLVFRIDPHSPLGRALTRLNKQPSLPNAGMLICMVADWVCDERRGLPIESMNGRSVHIQDRAMKSWLQSGSEDVPTFLGDWALYLHSPRRKRPEHPLRAAAVGDRPVGTEDARAEGGNDDGAGVPAALPAQPLQLSEAGAIRAGQQPSLDAVDCVTDGAIFAAPTRDSRDASCVAVEQAPHGEGAAHAKESTHADDEIIAPAQVLNGRGENVPPMVDGASGTEWGQLGSSDGLAPGFTQGEDAGHALESTGTAAHIAGPGEAMSDAGESQPPMVETSGAKRDQLLTAASIDPAVEIFERNPEQDRTQVSPTVEALVPGALVSGVWLGHSPAVATRPEPQRAPVHVILPSAKRAAGYPRLSLLMNAFGRYGSESPDRALGIFFALVVVLIVLVLGSRALVHSPEPSSVQRSLAPAQPLAITHNSVEPNPQGPPAQGFSDALPEAKRRDTDASPRQGSVARAFREVQMAVEEMGPIIDGKDASLIRTILATANEVHPERYFFAWRTDSAHRGDCLYHPVLKKMSRLQLNVFREVNRCTQLGGPALCEQLTRSLEIPGIEGARTISALILKSNEGGGDAAYWWINPDSLRRELKQAYVVPFRLKDGGSALLGAGIYFPFTAAEGPPIDTDPSASSVERPQRPSAAQEQRQNR